MTSSGTRAPCQQHHVVTDLNGDGIINVGEIAQLPVTDYNAATGIEHAYVELGGFRIGVTDSLFVT